MPIFSYHLLRTRLPVTFKALILPPKKRETLGLIHSESLWNMRLGAPIFSPDRAQLIELSFFAEWQDESSLDAFLQESELGRQLALGWHVRMQFVRKWGSVEALNHLPEKVEDLDEKDPVVAVTLARMRFSQIPRFIHWGKPVEEQVRDSPGVILALASMRLPNTVSTFTIWETQKAMLDMVKGHNSMNEPKRHLNAMKERDKKDFHYEFTTLRFKPLSEHGFWNGKQNYIRKLKTA